MRSSDSSKATSARSLFEQIRPLLNGEHSVRAWRALLSALDAPAADSDVFEREYAPAIRATLDREWDDLLRVVGRGDPARVRRWGVIYKVTGERMAPKAKTRNHPNYKRELITRAVADARRGVGKRHYRGVLMDGIEGYPDLVLDALIATGAFAELEYFFFKDLHVWSARRGRANEDSELVLMCEKAFELSGSRLRGFGGTMDIRLDQCRKVWRLFGERIGEFTALEVVLTPIYLTNANAKSWPETRWMKEGSARRVKILDLVGDVSVLNELFSAAPMRQVEAVSFLLYDDEIELERWIEEHSALAVRRWCVETVTNVTVRFEGERMLEFREDHALYWERRLGGGDMFPRDEAALEVGKIGAGATHELLFDSGRLKPSQALEALSVSDLSRRDALKLIAQAPEAWPNLRALYLGSAGCTDGELWRVLTESALFAQLDYLDGGGMDSHALKRAWTATVDSEDSVRTFRELIGALVDEVFDGTHHPFFAYRLLVHVVAHTSTVARMGEIAKMLGMARQGREPRADLAARILVEAKTRLAPDGISPNPYVAQHPAWRSGACTREALAVAERELQNTVVGRSG